MAGVAHADSGTTYSAASGSFSSSWAIIRADGIGESTHISVSVGLASSAGNLKFGVLTLCTPPDTDAPTHRPTLYPTSEPYLYVDPYLTYEVAGGVGGGVALIVAAVVIAIVIRRRRRRQAASVGSEVPYSKVG
jgi:hypothetical protein